MFTIQIYAERGHNLVAKDLNGKSDPYCLMGWAGEGDVKFDGTPSKSIVQEKTLDPWFRSPSVCGIDGSFDAKSKTKILVQIWDADKIGSDEFMGQAIINVSDLEITRSSATLIVPLGPRPGKKDKVSGTVELNYTYFTEEAIQKAKKTMTERIAQAWDDESVAANLAGQILERSRIDGLLPSQFFSGDILYTNEALAAAIYKGFEWFAAVSIGTENGIPFKDWEYGKGPASTLAQFIETEQSVQFDDFLNVLIVASKKASDQGKASALFHLMFGTADSVTADDLAEAISPLFSNWAYSWGELPFKSLQVHSYVSNPSSTQFRINSVIDHIRGLNMSLKIAEAMFKVGGLTGQVNKESFVAALCKTEVRQVMKQGLNEVAYHVCLPVIADINSCMKLRFSCIGVNGESPQYQDIDPHHPRVHLDSPKVLEYIKHADYVSQHREPVQVSTYRDFVPLVEVADPELLLQPPVSSSGNGGSSSEISSSGFNAFNHLTQKVAGVSIF